jgi:hypothetical protein
MITVLCYCQVADYESWRAGYAHALQVTPGVRTYRLWRGLDDLNFVVVEETFDTREEAVAAWTSAETEQAMIADGIDMASVRIEYVEQVDAGTL